MIRKVKHIVIGWGKKYGWLPTIKAEEKLSELRLRICQGCPFHEASKVLEILNGHANYVDTIYCKKCSCPASQKSLVVDEKCPVDKW